MGVLDARYNAEKVGYPVVGEAVKEASNVVDYFIREEQTKDISAEINANNQTTTGMANVIPGINAPKLFAETSIYSIASLGSVGANLYHDVYFVISDTTTPLDYDIKSFVISSETGDLKFKPSAGGLIIPKTASYMIRAVWAKGLSICKYDTKVMQDNEVVYTYHGVANSSADTSDLAFVNLTKGKKLWVRMTAYYLDTGTLTVSNRNLSMDIQSIT